MIRQPPRSTLFPYTTLFRSLRIGNQMRELLVVHFDGANGFAHGGFINRRDGYDLVSSPMDLAAGLLQDRKSTRLNSSHLVISYAVFCLQKNNTKLCVRSVAV